MSPSSPERPSTPELPEEPELLENQRRFDNIRITARKNKNGQVVGWQSSAPGRKVIEVPAGLVDPADIEGIEYTIYAEDQNPDDPNSGKFVAFSMVPNQPTPSFMKKQASDWQETEHQADVADRTSRERNTAQQSLRRVTGKTMAEQAASETKLSPGLERIVEVATQRAITADEELEMLLGPEESPVRELVDLRRHELMIALRAQHQMETSLISVHQQQSDILRTFDGKPDAIATEVLENLRAQEQRNEGEMDTLRQTSPEAFIGLNLRELKAMRPSGERIGRIIETPSTRELVDDITTHLLGNKPVLIYGHLGVGKTELAMFTAREMLAHRSDLDTIVAEQLTSWKGAHPEADVTAVTQEQRKLETAHKSAVVISGSKQASLGELYGHQVLTLDGVGENDIQQFIDEVAKQYDGWVVQHPKATETDKGLAHDRYLQAYMTQYKNGTISKFFLGPIYQAAQEGRPIIIDEVNAFRHEILISLNHILTRKAGDIINVQQNSGTSIEVQRGFGVIMTGNINNGEEKYVDRQQLDPAFLSRLYRVEMDYLPQAVEGPISEAPEVDNELFRAMVAKMIDRNGNLSGPRESLERLWDLSKAARVIQDVFAGRQVKLRDSASGREQTVAFKQGVERGVDAKLNEAVLSMRSVNSILDQWQAEGYRYELDYYLWKEFVGQTIDTSDRAFLYQILHDYFGFFTGNGWPTNPDYGSGGEVKDFRVTPPKNEPGVKEFKGPRDYLPKIYGEVPARHRFPKDRQSDRISTQ